MFSSNVNVLLGVWTFRSANIYVYACIYALPLWRSGE